MKEQWVGMVRGLNPKVIRWSFWVEEFHRISSFRSPRMNMDMVFNKDWTINYRVRLKKILKKELKHVLFSQSSYFLIPSRALDPLCPRFFPKTLTLKESLIVFCLLSSLVFDVGWDVIDFGNELAISLFAFGGELESFFIWTKF